MTDQAGGFREVRVVRSARRTRSVSAHREGDALVVRIPARLSPAEERRWVQQMQQRVLERERRAARRGDVDLMARATALSAEVIAPKVGHAVVPTAIRWVDNQQTRWGSCSTDSGEIRLSSRLKQMPPWVVDQVILHELGHLVEPSHNRRFHELVSHPDTERANAWLEGLQAGRASRD